jgi:hypothetical protein
LPLRLADDWTTNANGTVTCQGHLDNHYSAQRGFEDLLGVSTGGADGHGRLGFAATAHDFGSDVFDARPPHLSR